MENSRSHRSFINYPQTGLPSSRGNEAGTEGDRSGPCPDRRGCSMVIAGGGTGGHLFPGIAIAEEFLRRGPGNRVLFVGTERGLEKKILGGLGFPLRTLKVEGLKGRGPVRVLASLLKIPGSLMSSFRILRTFQPSMVVGVGGYASGPVVLTAYFLGIPTAIAEQNAFPGLTNRILGRFARRIFVTFPESARWFPADRTRVTGNPVRSVFLRERKNTPERDPHFTLLIFGGSQGAHAINRAIMDALHPLESLKDRLRFIHQTGEKDLEAVDRSYREQGFVAEVRPFITEMASAYRAADLLVCRAGATSIAEITGCGKAAILIPFPFAVNDHQTQNAELLAQAGAAALIPEKDLDGPRLAALIEKLYHRPEDIEKMERASTSLGNVHAAANIVDICMDLIETGSSTECPEGSM